MEETVSVQPATQMTTDSAQSPDQSTSSQTPRKSGSSMLGIVIALVVFLGLGSLAFAAANMGKGNAFSQLSAVIPFEKIPVLNSIGKSDETLLRDAFPATGNFALAKRYGGSEWKGTLAVTGNGTETESAQKLNIDLHMDGSSAVSGDMEKTKALYSFGGKVSTGAVTVDLGQDGLKLDALMPNANEMYFSVRLSDTLKSTIDPYIAQYNAQFKSLEASGMPAFDLNDLFNTYWKLDLKEYMKFMNEQTGTKTADYDFQKYHNAVEKLMADVGPDFQKMYSSTLGDFTRYAKVTDYGRQAVNGRPAVVVGLQIENDKVPPVVVEFGSGIVSVMEKHADSFKTFCETVSENDDTKAQCATDFSAEKLKSMEMSDADKADQEKQMQAFMKEITINSLKFSISPVDNTLLKFEAGIDASKDGLANAGGSGMTWDKLGMTMSWEEVSRGKDPDVVAPTEFKDLVETFKQFMAVSPRSMSPALRGGTPGMGTTPRTLSPEVQKLMEDPQYQQYLQQYGAGGAGTTFPGYSY